MLDFIIRRLAMAVPVLIGASIVIFLLIRLVPGDPAIAIAGPDASDEDLTQIRESMSLNDPIYVQYWTYISRAVQGDLGHSYYYKKDIMDMIRRTLPATLELSFVALIVSLALAIPAGVISAVRRNSWIDHGSMLVAVLGVSIPVFWLATMLIYVFAVRLKWLPASGRGGTLFSTSGVEHIVLPAISLGAIMMASTTRLTRGSMLEVLNDDYVRTARAKGLRERAVIVRHALRNAMIPVTTNVGLQIGSLLAGSFLTETVFAWPGIGRLSVDAMYRRDYPLVQGTLLLVVTGFILVNLLVDVLYVVLDPRIRHARG
jgi:peptide/nickel transport system permease protein